MLARERNIAILLTVVSLVLLMACSHAAWYVVDGPSTTRYYLMFSDLPPKYLYTEYYRSYYSSSDIAGLMDAMVGLMILWAALALAFVWTVLRESRLVAVLFASATAAVPLATVLYFALAVPEALELYYVVDFAGETVTQGGSVYAYGPGIGWYLCAAAAALQAACAIQFIIPNAASLRKGLSKKE